MPSTRDSVIRRIEYEHPLFSLGAVAAQEEIPELNVRALAGTRTYFAGAWQQASVSTKTAC
jgi:predicted NAD/FAD-binding protein